MSPLAQRALLISGSCSAVVCVLAGPLVLLAAIVCEWWATRPGRDSPVMEALLWH